MLGLLGASFWCWAIIIDKTMLFRRMRSEMDALRADLLVGQSPRGALRSLSSGRNRRRGAVRGGDAGMEALVPRAPAARFRGLHARIDKVLDVSIAREVERLELSLLFLATVASAGPFVGLFGTVWGIMTSFRSIAASKNTSLAVVAPGIAEALLATAIGLFAAIPALIAYNKLQGDVARAQARLESFADEFSVDPVAADRPASARRARAERRGRFDGRLRSERLRARAAAGGAACRATARWPTST